jgi:hypothetical protein
MKAETRKDAVMFWSQPGTNASRRKIGLTMDGYCLLVATLLQYGPDDATHSEDGYAALWYAESDVDEFFDAIDGNDSLPDGGPWICEATWTDNEVGSDEDDWSHLVGHMRRPTPEEWADVYNENGAFRWL